MNRVHLFTRRRAGEEITQVGHAPYDLLQGFSGYRAAIVGWSPESLVDLHDLETDGATATRPDTWEEAEDQQLVGAAGPDPPPVRAQGDCSGQASDEKSVGAGSVRRPVESGQHGDRTGPAADAQPSVEAARQDRDREPGGTGTRWCATPRAAARQRSRPPSVQWRLDEPSGR